MTGHLDPQGSKPRRGGFGFLFADVDFQELRSVGARLEQRVGVLRWEHERHAIEGLQHLVLAHQAQGLSHGVTALVAALNGADLPFLARGVEAFDLPTVFARALHCAVRGGPERLPNGIVAAKNIAATLLDGDTLVCAENVAFVALAALGAGGAAGQRSG